MLNSLSWLFYVIGILMILASWINLISSQVGWIGWIIGMVGWGLGHIAHSKPKNISESLQQLSDLHSQGKLSEQEFITAKQKLLSSSNQVPVDESQSL